MCEEVLNRRVGLCLERCLIQQEIEPGRKGPAKENVAGARERFSGLQFC